MAKKSKGTRRSTILNRRAATTARLKFYAKRLGLAVAGIGVLIYGGYLVQSSGWYNEKLMQIDLAFNEKSAGMGFQVENLLIDGRGNTDKDAIKAALQVEKDRPIFAYDLNELKARVETLSWIKSATVERRLPATLYVKLEERVPVAIWQRQGRLTLVDQTGFAITDKNLQKYKDLMIVVGDGAPQKAAELIGLLNAEPDLQSRVNAAKWIGGRRWDLELKNGIMVHLPEEDAGFAVKKLADAQRLEGVLDRRILSVDLRDENRLIVQTSPGAVDKYEASYKKEKNI